jgi:hypothetical protein
MVAMANNDCDMGNSVGVETSLQPKSLIFGWLIAGLLLSACEKSRSVKWHSSPDRVPTPEEPVHVLSERERSTHVLRTLVDEYDRLASAANEHDETRKNALIKALCLQVEKLPLVSELSEIDKNLRARAVRIFDPNHCDEQPLK